MNNTIELYSFKGFDMGDFISRYLYEITPHEVIDEKTLSCFETAKMKITEPKEGAKNRTTIENKCLYLQDSIIRRAYNKDNRAFNLSSNILKRVLGNEYSTLLLVLIDMEYLRLGFADNDKHNYYLPLQYSTIYSLPTNVEIEKKHVVNYHVKRMKEKTASMMQDFYEEQTLPEMKWRYGEEFCLNYVKSLNKFKIEDLPGLESHLTDESDNNFDYSIYIQNIKESFSNKKVINSVDGTGRIYHLLSNLKKEYKKYINIDFELDCKNSNPLLLNYFLFQYKGIDIYNSYKISNILYNYKKKEETSFHNVSENLCNLLIDNNIEKSISAKFSNDELLYIYLTTTGQLWDMLLEEHQEYSRSEIKQAVFAQVYFSGSSRITEDKPFAALFRDLFPSVYKFIVQWKKPFINEFMSQILLDYGLATGDEVDFKEYSSLSLVMMHLESILMTSVLKEMYRKRWNAVNIHDCIVVPKTTNKNRPTVEEVKTIMEEVYQQYGLKATFG